MKSKGSTRKKVNHSRRWPLIMILCLILIISLIIINGLMKKQDDELIETIEQIISLPDFETVNSDGEAPFYEYSKTILSYGPRVPSEDEGYKKTKAFLLSKINTQNWHVELNTFKDRTPVGEKEFTNILATWKGSKVKEHAKTVILAAHYESKDMPGFLGACDSVVPVSMMIQLMEIMDKHPPTDELEYNIQMIFIDGEEAFQEWSRRDSLYGSRHLVDTHLTKQQLGSIDVFILLDLIGTSDTQFVNFHYNHQGYYRRLASYLPSFMSSTRPYRYHVDDDHRPFMEAGVPVLHLISVPFPKVWHRVSDNLQAISHERSLSFFKGFSSFFYDTFLIVRA